MESLGFAVSFLFLLLGWMGCVRTEDSELGHVVKELRAEIQALQRGRDQDRILIKRLDEKVDSLSQTGTTANPSETHHSHHHKKQRAFTKALHVLDKERRNLELLDVQLRQMKDDLVQVVQTKERQVVAEAAEGAYEGTAEWIRIELQRLRQELEGFRSKREEDDHSQASQLKTGLATIRWLQETLEQLKTEMSELAKGLNISDSLRQKQEFEVRVGLMRSDVLSLRAEMDSLRASEEKDAAELDQVQSEVSEIRKIVQHLSLSNQELSQQVSELTEDVHNLQYKEADESKEHDSYSLFKDKESKEADDSKEEHHGHHFRHNRELRTEVQKVVKGMKRLQAQQSTLSREVSGLKRNNTIMNTRVQNLEFIKDGFQNHSTPHHHQAGSKVIRDLDEELHRVRDRVLLNSENIQNITGYTTGIDKLHTSTVELFQALEKLEGTFQKNLRNLQKEVSKCDFNIGHIQSFFKVLQEDQSSQFETLKAVKKDVSFLQGEVQRDRYKILLLESEIANKTLQECKRVNEQMTHELKYSTIRESINKLTKKLEENENSINFITQEMENAVDRRIISKLSHHQNTLKENLENITAQLPQMTRNLTWLRSEISKFEERLPHDCSMDTEPNEISSHQSGIYLIHPKKSDTTQMVYCDMETAGGRWTVLQRRFDGSEDFNRTWDDYKSGFGDKAGEYWIGNDAIHQLTSSDNYSLRIDLWDTSGNYKFVEYDHFYVAPESEHYRLTVRGYHGNASNSLEYHSGMAFSTRDQDNDASSTHCAMYYSSGWWYNHCQYVNINGKYNIGLTWYDGDALEWEQLSRVEMKMRPSRIGPT